MHLVKGIIVKYGIVIKNANRMDPQTNNLKFLGNWEFLTFRVKVYETAPIIGKNLEINRIYS